MHAAVKSAQTADTKHMNSTHMNVSISQSLGPWLACSCDGGQPAQLSKSRSVAMRALPGVRATMR